MSREKPKEPSRKPTVPVGTEVGVMGWGPGQVVAVRRRKKYPRRYLCILWRARPRWFRRDEILTP